MSVGVVIGVDVVQGSGSLLLSLFSLPFTGITFLFDD